MKQFVAAAALAVMFVTTPATAASLDGTHVHGLAYDPADPDRLLIATHHGLKVLENGTVTEVSERPDDFMGFSVHPDGAGVFLASGHPAGGGNLGVIVSRNGGRSWEVLSPGVGGPVDFHQMDVSKADPDIMVGVYGDVQVSRDGGRTWSVTGRPPAPVLGLALSATDAETLYAATQGGLFVSTDLGARWSPIDGGEAPASMVTTTVDGSVYAYDLARGLTRRPPASDAWEPVGPPLPGDAILHLAVKPGEMAAATYKGALLRSADGGRSWRSLLD